MHTSNLKLRFLLVLASCAIVPSLLAQSNGYLPLAAGNKWTLENAKQSKPVTFEVTQNEGDGFRIHSTTPWSSSEWTLVGKKGQFFMTGYGTGAGMMPMPKDTLYFDFSRPAGTTWSNSLGSLTIVSTNLTVQTAAKEYRDCIQIRHKFPGGQSVFTFAQGTGFVQFGEGANAFLLTQASTSQAATVDSPPQNQNGASASTTGDSDGHPLIGLTANRMATDPDTAASSIRRFDQTIDTGVSFIVANGKWTELEPKKGRYKLDSVNYLLVVSKKLPVSFTLRIIDTVGRNVPPELEGARWNSPIMEKRLLALIDALAPLLNGRVQWFMLGYEVNEYFNRHPDEVNDFVELYRVAAAHARERMLNTKVSSTLMFLGSTHLEEQLKELNKQLDFLALTYAPLKADFSVEEPSVLLADFATMARLAGGRKIVLQEIGYPSSPEVNSSEDKQAEFYLRAFEQIRHNPQQFEAVNWMTLADLGESETRNYAHFYGLPRVSKLASVLQTMGLFDAEGRPKKSWDIFLREMKHPAATLHSGHDEQTPFPPSTKWGAPYLTAGFLAERCGK